MWHGPREEISQKEYDTNPCIIVMHERKVILYIAMSLDVYIAGPSGEIEFLSSMDKAGEDYGYANFLKEIDTIIIGRKTFDKLKEMGYQYPHTDKKVYIITHTTKPDIGTFEYYTGNLTTLISKIKNLPGKHIYCDGGADLATALLQENLIDEILISIIPMVLGEGIRLFKSGIPSQRLKLLETKYFEKGLVRLHYCKE
ncbi:MAG: dihydrofolate reductase family protein [Ferruginibacter sp.]